MRLNRLCNEFYQYEQSCYQYGTIERFLLAKFVLYLSQHDSLTLQYSDNLLMKQTTFNMCRIEVAFCGKRITSSFSSASASQMGQTILPSGMISPQHTQVSVILHRSNLDSTPCEADRVHHSLSGLRREHASRTWSLPS